MNNELKKLIEKKIDALDDLYVHSEKFNTAMQELFDEAEKIKEIINNPAYIGDRCVWVKQSGIVHELKTWDKYFQKIKSGEKTFEVRKNDRNYQVGDSLLLKEWIPEMYDEVSPNRLQGNYTGEELKVVITYILQVKPHEAALFGIDSNTCVMSISCLSETPSPIPVQRIDELEYQLKALSAIKKGLESSLTEAFEKIKKEEQDHYYTRCAFDTTTENKNKLQQETNELKNKYGELEKENERLKGFLDTYRETNSEVQQENTQLKQRIKDLEEVLNSIWRIKDLWSVPKELKIEECYKGEVEALSNMENKIKQILNKQ